LCAHLGAQPPQEKSPESPPTLVIPRVKRAPKLSDFLNNVPREAEAVVTDFRQFDPGDGVPISQPTTAYLSYDDDNLYVGWICKDDPKLIRSRVARRKDILWDDRVTINIDTFHDHRHAYWFDVNAHGIQFDGITTDGYGDDFSWESLWYTDAKITADGYVVLETIPFKSLRFPAAPKQKWGIVLIRFIYRNNEMSCWPHISRTRMPAFVAQFGDMEGLEEISPGRNLQFIPYAAGTLSRNLEQPPGAIPAYVRDRTPRAGIDAKAVIKDALTLDMTLNPDFSQVESDEPQVTTNQRYEVFFPEKRPFFMENASYFQTPQQLFFSRRIVDPQFGIRLTGKVNRWGIGVLSADDRAPDDRAYNNVLTLQRDFLKDSHLRVMAADREQASAYNRVGSLDGRLRLPRTWFLSGQAVHSDTKERGGTFGGNTYFGGLSHMGRSFQSITGYTDRSPGFRADLGYIPRVDIREVKQQWGYRWRPTKRAVVSYGPSVNLIRNWNHAGLVQDWEINPFFEVELLRLSQIEFGRREAFELYQGIGFRKGVNYAGFKTEYYKWLSLNGKFARGTNVNYYPAAGLKPFLADSTDSAFGFTLRPTTRMRIDETYLYSRLATICTAVPVFNNHILRSKVNYQFTREFALRAIVDYNGLLPNTSLIDAGRNKKLTYDFLFTWLLHPGTAIYAGYTDIYQNMVYDPSRPPYLQPGGGPTLNTGRQAFVKLSYLFRF
jgi:hypothetical protein